MSLKDHEHEAKVCSLILGVIAIIVCLVIHFLGK